jgi:OmpA-OmpF porin, OOP family
MEGSMTINILDMLQNAVGKDLSTHASKLLGESEGGIGAATQAALPALLGGVMSKASTLSGATDLLNMLKGPAVSSDLLLKDLGGLFGGDETTSRLTSLGTTLLNSVFGDKLGALAGAIGSLAGIRGSSATSLLGMLAPLLFSFLKGQVTKNNLGATGLMSLLGGQSEFLQGKLSDKITNALGLGSATAFLGGIGDKLLGAAKSAGLSAGSSSGISAPVGGPHGRPPADDGGYSLLKRLRPWLLLALGIPLFFLFRSCGESEDLGERNAALSVPKTVVEPTVVVPAAKATVAVPETAPAVAAVEPTAIPTEVPLPTAAPTAVPKAEAVDDSSTRSAAVSAPPAARIYFDVGKTKLPGDIDSILQSIVDYALAHSNSGITIAGFHDPTGNQAKNAELAKNRALAVRSRLVSLGIGEAQIDMKKPEVTTGSGDNKEARRVEVSVK